MTTEAIKISEHIIESEAETGFNYEITGNFENETTITSEAIKPAAKKRILRTVIIVSCLLLSITLIASAVIYVKVSAYFETRFFPNTMINGLDVSHLTKAEAVELIFAQSLVYQLEVFAQDNQLAGIVNAADIGLFIDIDMDVETALTNQDEKKWFQEYAAPETHEIIFTIHFDHQLLATLIREWDTFTTLKFILPENAYLGEYNEEIKGYEIVPAVRGTWIDMGKAEKLLGDAIYNQLSQINIEAEGCYIRPKITSDDRNLNHRVTLLNRMTSTCITYDWNGREVILDGDLIHQWIVEEAGVFTIDKEAVREFVIHHAKENDTYGQRRTFTTTAGVERRLPGGGYGWRTDRSAELEELMELIPYGVIMDREPIYSVTGWNKGQDDIGSTYIEIDLGNQRLYLYEEGRVVLESELVSGNMERGWGTPEGIFGLTYKERNAVLRGENYRTPVSYWMPFNGNIGMHDATWRSAFGGDIYVDSGSHGCINLPFSKAKEIYAYISTGFPVICYY